MIPNLSVSQNQQIMNQIQTYVAMNKGNVNLSGMVGPSDQQPYSHLPFGSSLLMTNPGGQGL